MEFLKTVEDKWAMPCGHSLNKWNEEKEGYFKAKNEIDLEINLWKQCP